MNEINIQILRNCSSVTDVVECANANRSLATSIKQKQVDSNNNTIQQWFNCTAKTPSVYFTFVVESKRTNKTNATTKK